MSYFDLDDKEFIVGLQELIREDEIYEEARIMVEFIEGIEEAMKKEKEEEEEEKKGKVNKETKGMKEVLLPQPLPPPKKRMKLLPSNKPLIILDDDDDDDDDDDGNDNDDGDHDASEGMRATFAEREQQQRYLEEIVKKYKDQ